MNDLPARVLAAIENLDDIKEVFCHLGMYDHAANVRDQREALLHLTFAQCIKVGQRPPVFPKWEVTHSVSTPHTTSSVTPNEPTT